MQTRPEAPSLSDAVAGLDAQPVPKPPLGLSPRACGLLPAYPSRPPPSQPAARRHPWQEARPSMAALAHPAAVGPNAPIPDLVARPCLRCFPRVGPPAAGWAPLSPPPPVPTPSPAPKTFQPRPRHQSPKPIPPRAARPIFPPKPTGHRSQFPPTPKLTLTRRPSRLILRHTTSGIRNRHQEPSIPRTLTPCLQRPGRRASKLNTSRVT